MVVKMLESGFCAGVQSAVNKANEQHALIIDGKKVYLYGDLVNNDYVMQDFKDRGFEVIKDINKILPGSTVIIRAHGVSKNIYETLSVKNATIKDCTCPKVVKIHEIVKQKSLDGYRIVIIGKKGHPEVEGTVGWSLEDSVEVIENTYDLNDIDLTGKLCVVAQTTCKRELWETVTTLIRDKNPAAEIEDTLCPATGNRERKAKELAEYVDVMVVVGSKNSSNSCELYDICKASCKNAFFINSLGELDGNNAAKKAVSIASVIGIAGSASTPLNAVDEIYGYLSFLDFLGQAKKEIEIMSEEYFNNLISNAGENTFIVDSLNALYKQYKGGKRIRGAMVKLGEQIASHGSKDNYLPLAVGYEIFQTAILIHDDIIDKSEIRRGKPTIHVETSNDINNKNKTPDTAAEHFGMSRALCIGDYGFFISYQILSECKAESSVLTSIFKLYSQILSKTCEGEIMDVILPYENIAVSDNYDKYCDIVTQIFEYKTAWYTLAGPIMLGAVCGGASDELIELLKNITIPLGIAFQIKDDLLGIYSSEEMLGKPLLSDIKENKQTLIYGYAFENACDNDKELLKQHYGNENADMRDLEIIKRVFQTAGAKKYAESEIKRLSEISRTLINNPLIAEEHSVLLNGLASYLTTRKF
jgi:4-hydroxy-3-methylbut-2-enyl diphosphate reductase